MLRTPILGLFGILVCLAPISGQASPTGCALRLQRLLRSEAHREVEKLLRSVSPYREMTLEVRPLLESSRGSIFRARAIDGGDADVILKTLPLSEALNDFHGLRILREENDVLSAPIHVADPRLYIERSEHLSLSTRVIQQSSHIEGRPLFEVLADTGVPADRKERLRKRFETWMQSMKQGLEERGYLTELQAPQSAFFVKHRGHSLENQPPMLSARRAWRSLVEGDISELEYYETLKKLSHGKVADLFTTEQDITILLKSDNVMVDADDHLHLFDPH